MENERFPSRCCRPHHKRRSRKFYRDGDSSVVRNTVIKEDEKMIEDFTFMDYAIIAISILTILLNVVLLWFKRKS